MQRFTHWDNVSSYHTLRTISRFALKPFYHRSQMYTRAHICTRILKLQSKTREILLVLMLDAAQVSSFKYQPLAHICWTQRLQPTPPSRTNKKKTPLDGDKAGQKRDWKVYGCGERRNVASGRERSCLRDVCALVCIFQGRIRGCWCTYTAR